LATYFELKAQADALYFEAEKLLLQERAAVLIDLKEKISLYNITVAELGFSKHVGAKAKNAARRTTVAIKFRGPNGETWTGRGVTPRWLALLHKQGKKNADFLV
jgi:DNA-binding protein H-NS